MPLSWNEIRHRAIAFSKEWTGVRSERAEKQTFWNEFFNVFGLPRRAVASFEEPVKGISGRYGYIDLFWPKVALVEHKGLGKDLGKAESQAFRYIQDLAREGRADEIPRYVIVSDFARIALHHFELEEQGPFTPLPAALSRANKKRIFLLTANRKSCIVPASQGRPKMCRSKM